MQWRFARLAERSEQQLRTPDYLLFPHSKKSVIAEIKQFDANEEDEKNDKALRDGEPITQTWQVGERVRTKLSSATTRQLKAYQKNSEPAAVVLYNNVDGSPNLLDKEEILQAMYGAVQMVVAVPEEGPPQPLGTKHGGGRRVSEVSNTTLSAVAVLSKTDRRGQEPLLELSVYHNQFAANPLAPSLLVGPGVQHYRKQEGRG